MFGSTFLALLATALFAVTVSAKHVLEQCSATFCGTNGSAATCLSDAGHITTCAKYATTKASAISCAILPKTCSNSCYFLPVYGSDGQPYCTPCHLHVFSCSTQYTVYGPVPFPFPFPAERVGSKVANPALARKAIDTNTRQLLLPKCSMGYCTVRGAKGFCYFQTGKTTCGKFASTAESKEQCSFFCIQICNLDGPTGSDGKKYCSLCHLQQASCQSMYGIYGPILQVTPLPSKPPVAQECSVGFCTSNGAKASCKDKVSGNVSTCSRWAQTPAKDVECSFFCPLFCLPENERPVDNTGVKHCSGCQLQSASCGADFKFYGPVNSPVNDS